MGCCLSKKKAGVSSSLAVDSASKSASQIDPKKAQQKQIFIIKHRQSHDSFRVEEGNSDVSNPQQVCEFRRRSADNCASGHSRSSSTGKAAVFSESGGKYSGSKRSHAFDCGSGGSEGGCSALHGEMGWDRQLSRQLSGRRRTPSRERKVGDPRRESRSPGRRSKSPRTRDAASNSSASLAPAKMVSVSSIPLADQPNSSCAAIKRIEVKRNAGVDLAQQQPLSLSRCNSKKTRISPHRRIPLSGIDANIFLQTPCGKQNAESPWNNSKNKEETGVLEEVKASNGISGHAASNVIARSGSSRFSREVDVNREAALFNSTASYTSMLLEDIQNFHQKKTAPPFSLPACVTRACSILEAVADLNSSTGSNLPRTFTPDPRRNPINPITEQLIQRSVNKPASDVGKKRHEKTDPLLLESEVIGSDDLMNPTFHKYVGIERRDKSLEEQESSGSNSFLSNQQNWTSSSCWEPSSVDSTDCWESSSTVMGLSEGSPDGFHRHTRHPKKRELSDGRETGIGSGRMGFSGPQKAT